MSGQDETLVEILGYQFQDPSILMEALTHASASGEKVSARNNERLEFLGDRVLGLVVADILFERYPDESEGGLAKRHAALVSGKTLALVGRDINIGSYISFSDSEKNAGGAENNKLLANAMEAVIGALYLDGHIAPCRNFIEKHWSARIDEMQQAPVDSKSALQEWAQGRALPVPRYEMVGRSGPDHDPVFEISVTIKGYDPVTAKGTSRRKAEKSAAEKMLAVLKA